jgi:hypothetical protein
MTTPAPQQPSLGLRCLRLLEAVVWPALAVALPNWPDLATPLCVLFFCASISGTMRGPHIDSVPRLIRNLAVTTLGIGLLIRFLPGDGGSTRALVAVGLLIALARLGGFRLEPRPRWPWIAATFAAAFVLLALDHQRVVAAEAGKLARYGGMLTALGPEMSTASRSALERTVEDLRHPDRFWWVPLAVFAVLLPLSHVLIPRGMSLIRRRDVGRSRKAWFRRPANLSSD